MYNSTSNVDDDVDVVSLMKEKLPEYVVNCFLAAITGLLYTQYLMQELPYLIQYSPIILVKVQNIYWLS